MINLPYWLFFLIWIVTITMIFCLAFWSFGAQAHYSNHLLRPNERFVMASRMYQVPNLEVVGPAYLLKDYFVNDIRELSVRTKRLFDAKNIDYWPTGGSLIGLEVWKPAIYPMPFDDDGDGAVMMRDRAFVFSQQFVDAANAEGMDVFYAANTRYAERTGACVRLQLQGKSSATSDIFFWGEDGDFIRKSDGWLPNGTIIWNKKEIWKREHVFPLQRNVMCDGIEFHLVAHPREVLIQQYGARVYEHVPARSTFVSHLVSLLLVTH